MTRSHTTVNRNFWFFARWKGYKREVNFLSATEKDQTICRLDELIRNVHQNSLRVSVNLLTEFNWMVVKWVFNADEGGNSSKLFWWKMRFEWMFTLEVWKQVIKLLILREKLFSFNNIAMLIKYRQENYFHLWTENMASNKNSNTNLEDCLGNHKRNSIWVNLFLQVCRHFSKFNSFI